MTRPQIIRAGVLYTFPSLRIAVTHLEVPAEVIQTPSTFKIRMHRPPRTTLASQYILHHTAMDLQPHIKSEL